MAESSSGSWFSKLDTRQKTFFSIAIALVIILLVGFVYMAASGKLKIGAATTFAPTESSAPYLFTGGGATYNSNLGDPHQYTATYPKVFIDEVSSFTDNTANTVKYAVVCQAEYSSTFSSTTVTSGNRRLIIRAYDSNGSAVGAYTQSVCQPKTSSPGLKTEYLTINTDGVATLEIEEQRFTSDGTPTSVIGLESILKDTSTKIFTGGTQAVASRVPQANEAVLYSADNYADAAFSVTEDISNLYDPNTGFNDLTHGVALGENVDSVSLYMGKDYAEEYATVTDNTPTISATGLLSGITSVKLGTTAAAEEPVVNQFYVKSVSSGTIYDSNGNANPTVGTGVEATVPDGATVVIHAKVTGADSAVLFTGISTDITPSSISATNGVVEGDYTVVVGEGILGEYGIALVYIQNDVETRYSRTIPITVSSCILQPSPVTVTVGGSQEVNTTNSGLSGSWNQTSPDSSIAEWYGTGSGTESDPYKIVVTGKAVGSTTATVQCENGNTTELPITVAESAECSTDADCDDGIACTDDACVDGSCSNTDNCEDGTTCNMTTGDCEDNTISTTVSASPNPASVQVGDTTDVTVTGIGTDTTKCLYTDNSTLNYLTFINEDGTDCSTLSTSDDIVNCIFQETGTNTSTITLKGIAATSSSATIKLNNQAGCSQDSDGTLSLLANVTESSGDFNISSFTADPSTLSSGGGSSTLTYELENVNNTTCTIDQNVGSVSANEGTNDQDVSVNVTTEYTLSCSGDSGSDTDSTTVTVESTTDTVTITDFIADPDTIDLGDSSTLTWQASSSEGNAVTCTINGTEATSPLTVTPDATGDISYNLECTTEEGGWDTDTAIVTVNGTGPCADGEVQWPITTGSWWVKTFNFNPPSGTLAEVLGTGTLGYFFDGFGNAYGTGLEGTATDFVGRGFWSKKNTDDGNDYICIEKASDISGTQVTTTLPHKGLSMIGNPTANSINPHTDMLFRFSSTGNAQGDLDDAFSKGYVKAYFIWDGERYLAYTNLERYPGFEEYGYKSYAEIPDELGPTDGAWISTRSTETVTYIVTND